MSTDRPSNNIIHCKRCGTCCLKGGPVLHHVDKELLLAGTIGYQHLVTIRKGEPAYNPIHNRLEYVREEMIKVVGKDGQWACCFYREGDATCHIYEHRFVECRLLKCWDTADIMRIIGREMIVRSDIINSGDPILNVIKAHEEECPVQVVEDLITAAASGKDRKKAIKRLGELVAKDASIRSHAVSELGVKAEYELFIFGRPLSGLLADRGLAVRAPGEGR